MPIKGVLFSFCLVLSSIICWAQESWVRQAQAKMQAGKWATAKEFLVRALRKDSTHVEAMLTVAHWFYIPTNPLSQTDSAYRFINQAITTYYALPNKQREKLTRSQIDTSTLQSLRRKIDSTAFEKSKQINTEDSYNSFLRTHRLAKETTAAVELRDEIGFVDALKINSWQRFQKYAQTYPHSKRAEEAEKRYHQLFFNEKTRDGKIESYLSFVKNFSASPFIDNAREQIFLLTTAEGSIGAFTNYIQHAGSSKNKTQAINILYHLSQAKELPLPSWMLTDSLKKITTINQSQWIPFLQNKKIGFLDSIGQEALSPQYELTDETVLCKIFTHDVIFAKAGIFDRLGHKISRSYQIMKDIGNGFITVGDSSCSRLLHKSGVITISTCHQEFNVVGSFIAAKKNELWAIYTLTGRLLVSHLYDNIELIENVYVLSRLGKKTLVSGAQLAACADKSKLNEELVFDEVHPISSELLSVRMGALEGIINQDLKFTVPLARQNLSVTAYGLLRRINNKYSVSEVSPTLERKTWDNVAHYKHWLVLTSNSRQHVFDLSKKEMLALNPDSLWYDKGLLFIRENDSIHILVNSTDRISLAKESTISFVPSKDSVFYFYVENKGKKLVHAVTTGKKIFSVECSHIESLSRNTLLITRKNKVGLIGLDGKLILPVEYDAIVKINNRYFSILKDKKFGMVDMASGLTIKPQFDQNLNLLNEHTLIGNKLDRYGLIDWQGKSITKLEFDEIELCSESLAWVRKKNNWLLVDFVANKTVIDKIDRFKLLLTKPNEKIFLLFRGNLVGAFSDRRGVFIPINFSYIANVGSEDCPLYLTDKEVKEANLHVVIYHNQDGKITRKQVYEEDEFEQLICDGN
jgi:hypothetical protein